MANEWTYVGLYNTTPPQQGGCNGQMFLTGFDLLNPYGYMERMYSSLVSHQTVSYNMQLVSVDHIDSNATYSIQFDDMEPLVWTWHDITNGYSFDYTTCGGPGTDYLFYIMGRIQHSASTLRVRMSSTLDGSNGNFFGINNLRILLAKDNATVPTGVCVNQQGQFKVSRSSCFCTNSNAQRDPNQCWNCSSFTVWCYGTSLNQGYSCAIPGSYDGTNCGSCPDPKCFICNSMTTECPFCIAGYYRSWNYTCIDTCSAPYISSNNGMFFICDSPCQYNSTFLFANSICIPNCTFPFSTRIEGLAQFCDFPCNNSAGEYLLWNGSCIAVCPLHSRTDAYGYNYCDTCQSGYFSYPNNTCLPVCTSPYIQSSYAGCGICASPCPSGNYFFWNGSCLPTCPFYNRTNADGFRYCDACQPNYFSYPNTTCIPVCTAPFLQNSTNGSNFCISPCMDANKPYYLSDSHNCNASCDYPYITQNLIVCNSPCPNSAQPYYNTSQQACQATCDLPYITHNSSLCVKACPDATMLYYNTVQQTCQPTCDPPYLISNSTLCISPCSSTLLPYYNVALQICQPTCDAPNIIRNSILCENSNPCPNATIPYLNIAQQKCQAKCELPFIIANSTLCLSPCPDSAKPYYDTDLSTCRDTCDYPYVLISNSILCMLVLSEKDVKQVAAVTTVTATAGNVSGVVTSAVTLVSSGNPSAFLMQTMTKMLLYIKYIGAGYPPKLTKLMRAQKTNNSPFALLSSTRQGLAQRLPNHQLPDNFAQYGLYSAFLVNFWGSFISLLVVLFVLILSYAGEKLTAPNKTPNNTFKSISEVMRWNFSLMFFATIFDEVVLYTSLDIRTSSLRDPLTIFEWMVCLLVNSIAVLIICKSFYIIWKLQDAKSKASTLHKPELVVNMRKEYSRYEIVFKSYKDASFLCQACLPISLLRLYVFYLVISYLFDYPLVQSILITLMSIAMIIYFVICRPALEKLMLAQYVVQELFSLLVNSSVLAITVMDVIGGERINNREAVGDIIILANTFFAVVNSAIMCVSLIAKACMIIKERRMKAQQLRRVECVQDVSEKENKCDLKGIVPQITVNQEAAKQKQETSQSVMRLKAFSTNKETRTRDGSEVGGLVSKSVMSTSRTFNNADNSQMQFLQNDVENSTVLDV